MHMSDALLSPAVAVAGGAVAATLMAVAVKKLKNRREENVFPLMGVMGAFIFAAQMINFTIPGTGSSGHIVGGILLASMLGPWAAYLTLCSVLAIQALVFADGGLLALGCNMVNMAAMTCLVAYPLLFRPLMKRGAGAARIIAVSVLACTVGLEAGAAAVTAETALSGITALPPRAFLGLMTTIHLPIGICEGAATGAALWFISRRKPELLEYSRTTDTPPERRRAGTLAAIALGALLLGGTFSIIASSLPDGLEWSIARITGSAEIEASPSTAHLVAEELQSSTAVLPDYGSSAAGIIGSGAILLVTLGITQFVRRRR